MSDTYFGFNIGDSIRIKKEILPKLIFSYREWNEELTNSIDDLFKIVSFNVDSDHKIYDSYALKVSPVGYDYIEVNIDLSEIDQDMSGIYEKKGRELGALVDTKQAAYGNAITQTYEVVKAFMTPYFDEETKTYTIPQSLLQHLLLQVRIIDKQNRIFNNPNGDLMSESPYGDLGGYGLLGANMVIDK